MGCRSLFGLVLWSHAAGAEDAGTAKVTGIYQGMTGTITVKALDATKIHAEFALQAIGQTHTGGTSGDGLLKNGAATIVPDANAPCSFALQFADKSLHVEQTGMSNECGLLASRTKPRAWLRYAPRKSTNGSIKQPPAVAMKATVRPEPLPLAQSSPR